LWFHPDAISVEELQDALDKVEETESTQRLLVATEQAVAGNKYLIENGKHQNNTMMASSNPFTTLSGKSGSTRRYGHRRSSRDLFGSPTASTPVRTATGRRRASD